MTLQRGFRVGGRFGLVAALSIGVTATTPSAATAPHGRNQGQVLNEPAKGQIAKGQIAKGQIAKGQITKGQVAQLKTSPSLPDAQPPSSATKSDDQTAPKIDQASPPGDSHSAVPSSAHDDRSAKDGEGEHPDRGLGDKGKGPPAKGPETPEIHMKDLGKVDTRIAVPPEPRRAGDKKQNPLLRSPMGRRILPPHFRPARTPPKRNSIGEILPSSAPPGARAPLPGSSPGAASPAIAAHSGEAPGNIAPGNATLTPSRAHPITAGPTAPRSTINGSNITRRSNAPAGIGGQAKPVVGINGSEIRPKH